MAGPVKREGKVHRNMRLFEGESGEARKKPEVLVTFIGLVYMGLFLFIYTGLYLPIAAPYNPQNASFALAAIPFTILFLALAYGVWRMNRFAFVGSAMLSGVSVLIYASFALDPLANPSFFPGFFEVYTVLFSMITTVVYSVLGVKTFWRKGATAFARKTSPRSSFFALIMLGFIAGGLVVGAFAGATQTRLLGNLGKSANISIVQGAQNQGNPAGYFSPASFTAKVGQAVTWSNGDGATHTVTSTTSGQFDSGSIPSGGTYSYTFTQAGTYTYYCTIHPWMKGTIVVTSG
jgi:plastocyanin